MDTRRVGRVVCHCPLRRGNSSNEDGHYFGQAIEKVRPDIRFTPKTIRMDDKRGIFVVYIPQSQRRPHMNQHDCKFYQRGDGGNAKAMEYQQVRDAMILGKERQRRILLFLAKLGRFRRLADEIRSLGNGVHSCFDRFDTTFYDTLLTDVWPALPDSLLLEKLMAISEAAGRVNNALNLAASPSGHGMQQGLDQHYFPAFERDLHFIVKHCNDAEHRFTVLFGPQPHVPNVE
jgi:hypothetical protein